MISSYWCPGYVVLSDNLNGEIKKFDGNKNKTLSYAIKFKCMQLVGFKIVLITLNVKLFLNIKFIIVCFSYKYKIIKK